MKQFLALLMFIFLIVSIVTVIGIYMAFSFLKDLDSSMIDQNITIDIDDEEPTGIDSTVVTPLKNDDVSATDENNDLVDNSIVDTLDDELEKGFDDSAQSNFDDSTQIDDVVAGNSNTVSNDKKSEDVEIIDEEIIVE